MLRCLCGQSLSGKRVYITRRIPMAGIYVLLNEGITVKSWASDEIMPRDKLLEVLKDGYDGLLCTIAESVSTEILDAAGSQLKAVCTMSVGYEHLDLEEIKKRNIVAANCSTVSSDCVSEFALGLMLIAARRMIEGYEAVKKKEWGPWKPMWLLGFELIGKTVGIVGLGRIGFGIAQRVNAFKIGKLIYFDVKRCTYDKDVNAEFVTFDKLLAESDMICIACNLTNETKGMFNTSAFSKMKPSACLINVSRGGIINHDDLRKALNDEVIRCAAIDVTEPDPLPSDHPLHNTKNLIITPHIASSTWEARNAMSEVAANNMIAILSGKDPAGKL
ncbi:glyoxylate reductase/hydroxypyruvate reductase isoform X2 [Octopus bimaculoides]|uniref:glyoxylate reductase/hydroxypyruvate reductase isoform X2 n=1 Tax=Octopus bimaculoides TaxID=37653 RepID=UPI00071D7656|nr:glyoxylate reductase/hydroxypyruvate reductase isoform X2 [Octopus bimaculoides]|eukprot:XP_014777326.1 PREDICTED: glyoxylate reductase/hydroxypyruvate reductase-like isoform X2 [Octopus bimaculoides]